jgi:hypothetical protein
MVNTFRAKDEWQRKMRDKFLLPYYQRDGGRCIVFDDRGPFSLWMQENGIDTIVFRPGGSVTSIEEKIVQWPIIKATGQPRATGYDQIALETQSCTVEGHQSNGWMTYCNAMILFYCMANREETALDCWMIDMPALHHWFWRHVNEFKTTMTDEDNHTLCSLVPIRLIREAGIKTWNVKLSMSAHEAANERAFQFVTGRSTQGARNGQENSPDPHQRHDATEGLATNAR